MLQYPFNSRTGDVYVHPSGERLVVGGEDCDGGSSSSSGTGEVVLAMHKPMLDKSDRWNMIASMIPPSASSATSASSSDLPTSGCVNGKTRNQCIRRYKYLKNLVVKEQ